MSDNASDGLTTAQLRDLDDACGLIRCAFTMPYLVGSAGIGGRRDWRDVDVRLILSDDDFDALCPTVARWELLSIAIGDYLRRRTRLPIDFQIQRMAEANAKHSGPRNPLGGGRVLAGMGDATPFAARGACP